MKKQNIIYTVGVIALLGLLIWIAFLTWKSPNTTTNQENETGIVNAKNAADPCDTAFLMNDFRAKDKAAKLAAQAIKNAIKNCKGSLSNGDTINVNIIGNTASQKSTRRQPASSSVRRTSTPKATSSSYRETRGAQVTESEFLEADMPAVKSKIVEGTGRKITFCVNVNNMAPDMHWPELGLQAGDQIENTVLNYTKDGHNILMYPVEQIGNLLYGPTTDKKIYVRADILDKFGADPNGVMIGSDYNNWSSWVRAEKIGNYYIADFNW